MKEDKKHIIFDFDGVIVDSTEMADRHASRHWNVTAEEQRVWAEGNMLAGTTADEVPDKLDPEEEALAQAFFVDYAADVKSCPIFDGMRQIIESLAGRYALHIVSSTPSPLIASYLEHCGVSSLFSSVYGMDTALSKSVKIGMIVDKEQVPLRNCIMVTDTLGDIREARHAGIEAIGVTWGMHDRPCLEKGSPWAICEIPVELPNAIEGYFAEV